MNIFDILQIITALVVLYIGITVFLKNQTGSNNIFFFLITICAFIWILTIYFLWNSKQKETAVFLGNLAFLGPALIPSFLVHFSFNFPEKKGKIGFIWNLIIGLPAFLFSLMIPLKLIISDVKVASWGNELKPGLGYVPFIVYFLFYSSMAFYFLMRKYFKEDLNERAKHQILYVVSGFSLTIFLAAVTNLIIPLVLGIGYSYRIGPSFTIIAALFISYAIAAEHLFDFDLFKHYSFMIISGAIFGFGATTLILFLLKYLFPVLLISVPAILLASAISSSFVLSSKYIISFLYNLSNEFILHHKYDYRDTMPWVAKEWLKIIELGELQKKVLADLKKVMKFLDNEVQVYLAGDWAIGSHPAAPYLFVINPDDLDDESGFKIPKENKFFQYLKSQQKILFLSDLEKEKEMEVPVTIKEELEAAAVEMKRMNVELAVPIIMEQMLVGFVEGMICFSGWAGRSIGEIEEADRNLFMEISTDASSAFQHALEKRKDDIASEKKENYLKRSLEKSKKLEEELAENKEKTYGILSRSSQYVTKIQILTEEQRELDAIMQNSRAGLLTIKNRRIRAANKQAENLLAGLGEKIIEKPFDKIFIDQFKNTGQIVENIEKVFKNEPVASFETEWIKTDKPVPVEVKIIPLFEGVKVEGALIEITDISEAKEKQKLLYIKEKYETFERLFEGLRHELNNAMNYVNIYSALIKKSPEAFFADASLKNDFCTAMPKVSRFVSELIDNVADAHLPLSKEGATEIEIQRVIEEILVSFEERLKTSLININKKSGQLPVITAVPRHIKEALSQIIKNSIEAIEEYDYQREQGQNPRSGGTIIIASKTNEAGQAEISISDDGIGMKEDFLNKVLDPFFTSKVHSVSHSETGTGLGLNKVYNIVKHYGGSFKITSVYGQGTTVVVSFGLKPEGVDSVF